MVILSQEVQKQLFADLLKTRRKTPVSESYFSEPTGFKPATSQQKESTKRYFLMNFLKTFVIVFFFQNTTEQQFLEVTNENILE